MQAIICHIGTSLIPKRIIVWIGAVVGKSVSTTQMGLLGKGIINPRNHSGIKPVIV